ncbi:hypothetical protein JZO70_07350 [Enterococcus sp. 669A]|uniref:Uncharacterized protein n=1 Tax=Candidatus Enterococcus moelleringii TaxID=2815325 RepID=A0ABS3LA47_9ENTE|nr:hypothetical protein [Enterococcus sp. 669A]MBO1305970.1 hypothetical protein [Enterococcus sp. 669A]
MKLEKLSKIDLLFLVDYLMEKDEELAVRMEDMLTDDISTEGIDRVFDRICARNQLVKPEKLAEDLSMVFGYILQNQLAEGYTSKVILASIQVYRRTSEQFITPDSNNAFSGLFNELFAIIRDGKKQLRKSNPLLLKHPLLTDEIDGELDQFTNSAYREEIEKVWEAA